MTYHRCGPGPASNGGKRESSSGGGGDPQARGRAVPDRLSRQPHHRGGGRGGYPDHHRAPGAHRAAHGRRGKPRDVRGAHRGFRDAARTRGRELVRRRRPGLRRLGPDRGPPRWLSAAAAQHPAELQLLAELPAHHQVGGAGDPGRGRARRDAPRFRASAQRPPPSGPGRAAVRSAPRGGAGRLDLCARAAPAQRAGSSRRGRRRGGTGRGRAAGALRRAGRALRPRLATAARAGRVAGGAGDDEPAGEERVPGDASARRSARAAARSPSRCTSSSPART